MLALGVPFARGAEGTGTVAGFLGLDSTTNGGGDHVILGGQGIYDLTRHYSLYGEIGIVPTKESTGADFDGGVVIYFNRMSYYKPYVMGSIGWAHAAGDNSFLIGGGGGVRMYFKRNARWGVYPELRILRLTGFSATSVTFTGGIFYDLRK